MQDKEKKLQRTLELQTQADNNDSSNNDTTITTTTTTTTTDNINDRQSYY